MQLKIMLSSCAQYDVAHQWKCCGFFPRKDRKNNSIPVIPIVFLSPVASNTLLDGIRIGKSNTIRALDRYERRVSKLEAKEIAVYGRIVTETCWLRDVYRATIVVCDL